MKNYIIKILITLVVIGATMLVIYYAKGYRINLRENILVQTGILHIETDPRRANFWLTEDFTGRTPQIVTSIPAGKYTLDIWLDGYHSIEYDVEIFAERSTPISIFLFKEEPTREIVEEIKEPIIHIHIDNSRNNALLLVEESKDDEKIDYSILRYQTNTKFWQLGANPSTLFSFSINNQSKIEEISISPSSKNLLITITNGEQEQTIEDPNLLSEGKHLISLDTQTVLANVTNIIEEIRWSYDGESLVWENEEGINKLNLKEPNTPILVYSQEKDTEILHYDSHTNGEIYILSKTKENSYVSLSRVSEELEKTFLIEKIYHQTEERFLENLREKEKFPYQPFKNSPQSTLFVGKPKEFIISKENQIIIFKTDLASYIYDIEANNYVLINPYETELLNFSPDGKKIAFLSLENEKLGFFRFDKEISNYSTKLGGNYLANNINKTSCLDFAWHQNSENIYYTCENTLYASDIKTSSSIEITKEFGQNILLENKNKVITLLEEDALNIIEFTVN